MANPYGFMGGGPPMGPGGPSGPMIGPQMPMMAPPPPPPDPATNNQPLQFNRNKGKPPMPMTMSAGGDEYNDCYDNKSQLDMDVENQRDEDLRNGNGPHNSSGHVMGPQSGHNGSMMSNPGPGGPGGMMGHPPGGMMGQWGPPMMMGPGGMMGPRGMETPHPDMMDQPMMMGGWGHMGGPGPGPGGPMPGPGGPPMIPPLPPNRMVIGGIVDPTMPRVPIVLENNTTLYPPPPTAPLPPMRERPPGCRTIFVGGLPENTTENLLTEIYEKCGELTSVRLSKKNFAHIRFEHEISVERALLVSGYRLKIENSEEKANTGRLHVDYAQARDDLYEWECQQRAMAREARHRQRKEQERLRPPSPPPVIHYSDHEAQILLEKVKDDESFAKASETLITWMDRGDVNRRTSNIFYSMVQSVNAHVKRLTSEKQQVSREFDEIKQNFMVKLEGILRQIGQVEKVFNTAAKQKAWDHFSKAQRKNMDTWRKICTEIREKEEAEFFRDRKEDEMEMSDDENSTETKKKKVPTATLR